MSRPAAEPVVANGSAARDHRIGVALGVAAYGMWGLFPLYWPLLRRSGAVEILAHRMVWSLVFVLAVLWWLGRRRGTGLATLRALVRDRRKLGLLAVAALLITANWGAYIWGVNNGHVVETALGYFIGPLVSVLIGVLGLGERLRRWQWVAVGLGGVAVVVLTVGYGRLPWVALILAFAFGAYGLVKKLASAGAVESLAVETGVTMLPALIYLGVLQVAGTATFTAHGGGHALLMIGGGIVSTLPLLAFAGAATRIPLSLVGLLQYIAPVMQFAFGVLLYREHMPVERWIGFTLVWLALVILTWDGLRSRARQPANWEPPG